MSTIAKKVSNGVNRSKLPTAGLASVAAAVAANLLAFVIIRALVDLPAGFMPLSVMSITFFTILGTGLGALLFAWLAGRSAAPFRTYRTIAIVAFVVSIIPNVLAALNPAMFPFPGGTAAAFLVLILFHVVAAVVSVAVLFRLAR
ncbi:conserved membrane protein of unknown function [Candidatus Promineifilum breve]|uniref:Uncharacterized protein n=1 Tax=Candidatus Promineifilum breve TaxID=1806508 RepID=A0A160T9S4_9CHLR|nr:DUF6069 family protein [Candidatus Promineifilum breve]CUS05810.1 conserved membrane protein of unknown function [Candidatus Promineifilum breve]